jgi:Fe-S-cluster-containing dehydrogenase component
MEVTRRGFAKYFARLLPGLAAAPAAEASFVHSRPSNPEELVSMLYDTTLCTGCMACVSACSQANGLIPDTQLSEGLWQMPMDLNSHTKNIIKLYSDPDNARYSFVKRQCMHCLDPACVSGCPFGALQKSQWGAVTWDGSRCIGCRYCEIACPFQVPKFEWDKWNPRIVKCEFCYHLLTKDSPQPACTRSCPTGAVIFGTRDKLLTEAKDRLAKNPAKYAEKRVYGEFEAGGTQVLYLSHVPFDKLGLPVLSKDSIAHFATKVHNVLYKFFWGPVVAFAFVARAVHRNWRHHQHEMQEYEEKTGLRPQL